MAYKFQMGEAILSGSTTFEEALRGLDTLDVSGQLSGASDLKIGGAAQIAGNADLNGQLDVAGDTKLAAPGVGTQIRGDLTVDEAAQFDSTVDIALKATLADELQVDGDVDINAQLDVSGDTKLAAPGVGTQIRGDLTVDQAAQFDSSISVDGLLSGSNNFALAGNADLNGQLDVAGDTKLAASGVGTQVRGDLTVDEAAQFDSTVDIAAKATLDDELQVLGAADLDSTLDVAGVASFASDISASAGLEVSGDADLKAALDVAGAAELASTLGVTAKATFNDEIQVIGDADLDGDLALQGDAAIVGSLDVDGEATLASAIIEDLQNGRVPYISGSGAMIDNEYFNVQKFGPDPYVVMGSGSFGGAMSASVHGPGQSLWFDNSASPYAYVNAGEFNFNDDFIARSDTSTFATEYDTTINATLEVNDDLQVNADGTITGELVVNGPITASSHVGIAGVLNANSAEFAASVQMDSSLHVDGGATVNQMKVENLNNADGGIVWSDADGDLFDNANFKYLNGSNELQVVNGKISGSFLELHQNATVAGNIIAGGFGQFGGTLSVAGVSDLAALTASADSVFEQNLHVMGDLDIDGDIIFNGDLEVDGNLQVDGEVVFTDVSGTMARDVDSIYFLDADDGKLKSYSWDALMDQVAGPGLTNTNGQLSSDAAAAPYTWSDTGTLAEGFCYMTSDLDGTSEYMELPASDDSAPGDSIIVKAKSLTNGASMEIRTAAASQKIDGEDEIYIESSYGAVKLVYVTDDTWRIS
tara:strand:+ start:5344 stop:7626 length:2283 start_codon:yes stop_codon:yes gene_type:complete